MDTGRPWTNAGKVLLDRAKGETYYLAALAAVAATYWVTARLSLNLALVHQQVTPVWPPTGVGLVAILVFGRRIWPAIMVAALAVNLPLGPSPFGAACIAVGNTLAPLASSELLARAGFRRQLDRMRDAVALIFLGGLLGMTISATVGSSVLVLSQATASSDFAGTWAVWWTGDAMGVLLVAPLLLSILPDAKAQDLDSLARVELGALLVGIGVVTYFLFQNSFRLEYLALPLITFAAWRFRLTGAAPAALIASVVAVWSAVHSEGPFATGSLFDKMVTLQAFNVSLSLAAILLASYVTVREQKEKLSRLYEAANLAISAKTEAINVAARELDPALGVLNSYLSILSDGQLGPAPSRWTSALNAMANRAWQVNQIMQELKQAAEIDANADSSEQSAVDLRPVLDRAIARAKNRAEHVGAQIELWYEHDPIVVSVDPLQVGRIIDNLISNSLTYSIRRPQLRVSASVENGWAVVRVVDNGVGMSETERIHAFRPFHRSEDPALREEPGTGLGLYVSAQLAAANNGTLVLEGTEAGKGSSFALYLPLDRRNSRLGNVRSESST